MSFAVFTAKKEKGNTGGLSTHIERRRWDAKQQKYVPYVPQCVIHPERSILNKDYLLKDGQTRSQAIENRIKSAGIARKLKADAVKAINIICTSDHEKMAEIEAQGRLDEWAHDCIDFCQERFGAKNVVSAVLHMDEKTPHLHITVVPIVEYAPSKRIVKCEDPNRKKRKYKKQETKARLCAKDVWTPKKSVLWQDLFADRMSKWGMVRGIEGSSQRRVEPALYNKQQAELAADKAKQQADTAKMEAQQAREEADKALAERDAAKAETATAKQEAADAKSKALKSPFVAFAQKVSKGLGLNQDANALATMKEEEPEKIKNAILRGITAQFNKDKEILADYKKRAEDAEKRAENAEAEKKAAIAAKEKAEQNQQNALLNEYNRGYRDAYNEGYEAGRINALNEVMKHNSIRISDTTYKYKLKTINDAFLKNKTTADDNKDIAERYKNLGKRFSGDGKWESMKKAMDIISDWCNTVHPKPSTTQLRTIDDVIGKGEGRLIKAEALWQMSPKRSYEYDRAWNQPVHSMLLTYAKGASMDELQQNRGMKRGI